MRRFDVPELHDYAWCPRIIRDGLTDFLEISIEKLDTYGPIRTHLENALAATGSCQVIDLCSGAGGPWPGWLKKRVLRAKVTLTDRFPNQRAIKRVSEMRIPDLSFADVAVDATAVPPQLKGFRTIFSALHHFPPAVAKQMIADAIARRQPIGIFELTSRTPLAMFSMLLSGIGVWWLTPSMRPFDWKKWILTYLIPVIPIVVSLDGVASCLRSYSLEELRNLPIVNDRGYTWKSGMARNGGPPVTYLIGYPA